jgi:hypothetical protein
MKTRMLLLIALILLTSIWACVDETDEPAPKVPDQELLRS